uniref:Uncharacterized protein n=2 Tax=Avena sativa TaxID=4498 RepID=A0ACD5ZQ49_AVESA
MASSKSSIENVTVVDSGALDCGVCESPPKPPIFQCEVGHMVCSECSVKMAAAETCHVCRRALSGGYKRCYGAEHIVDCLRVPCPNKAYGCSTKLARYDESGHLQACLFRPFHCPAVGCPFVTGGGLLALRDHFINTHRWPSTSVSDEMYSSTSMALVNGFNLIDMNPNSNIFSCEIEINPSGLLLLRMARKSYGRNVTAIHIRPPNAKRLWFKLAYETPCGTHLLECGFTEASTDLSASGGPSSLDCFQFVIPKSVQPLDADTIKVAFTCSYLGNLDSES